MAPLSLTMYYLTGKKETANYLHYCGHRISYADIQLPIQIGQNSN